MKNKKVTSHWTKKGNTKCSGLSIFKVSKTKDSFSALKSIFHTQHLFLDIWLWYSYMVHEKNHWNEESLHKFYPFLGQISKIFLIFFNFFSFIFLWNIWIIKKRSRRPASHSVFYHPQCIKKAILIGLVCDCVIFFL